jgi:hypothetical protein
VRARPSRAERRDAHVLGHRQREQADPLERVADAAAQLVRRAARRPGHEHAAASGRRVIHAFSSVILLQPDADQVEQAPHAPLERAPSSASAAA